LLAQEEDTVTVGQDLFRYDAGAAGESELLILHPALKTSLDNDAASSSEKPAEDKSEPPKNDPENEASQKEVKAEADPPNAPQHKEPSGFQSSESSKPAPAPPKSASDKPKPKEAKQESAVAKAPGSRSETRVKMSRMRLRIAERLKESQNAAASLTTFNEIDMSALMKMRSRFKDEVLKEHDVKLGFMSAFAKASCLALKEIPAANASIEGDEIVYRDYVDLSVAVATPKGLVTPVVRNAEGMGFVDIEKEIAALGKKARDNKLTIEDMAGGSFTM
jgi:2-oxoglutarate dehydrogenase E2 component (dihydrolipoamide succinyltransferase)